MRHMQHKRKRDPNEASAESHHESTTTPQPTEEDAAPCFKLVDNEPLNNPLIYRYKKRLPMRKSTGKRDVHITRTAAFRVLVARVISLLNESPLPVTLNAMGAAITKCCELALRVQSNVGGHVTLDVHTGTVVVYDDYEPLVEGYPEVTKTRNKSSIRITIGRTAEYV